MSEKKKTKKTPGGEQTPVPEVISVSPRPVHTPVTAPTRAVPRRRHADAPRAPVSGAAPRSVLADSSADSSAPDSLAPDSLAPDSLAPDSLAPSSRDPDSLIPDTLRRDRDGTVNSSRDSVAPQSQRPSVVDSLAHAGDTGDRRGAQRRARSRRGSQRRSASRRSTARRGAERADLALQVMPQPDDTTCGPTCLHAVYRYYGDDIDLQQVIAEVRPLAGGGTLAVWLANHALKRGYRATIHTYNLQIFDPTWFTPYVSLSERLKRQLELKHDPKLRLATEAYVEFLDLGGKIFLGERTSRLIRRYLQHGMPILTGLSATYLYSCAREKNDVYDDVEGEPLGHFVVLSGYDQSRREVMVADPLRDNPRFQQQYYSVNVERLMASIMLGIVTYDANLLILEPTEPARRRARLSQLPPADTEGVP